MNRMIRFVFVFMLSLMLWRAGLSFALDEPVEYGGVVSQEQREPQTQWVWGKVVSVDEEAKTITLKYLDYITDQDKELLIEASDTAVYENIQSINEIKLSDTLSVDYIIDAEGRNIAKNISVDKPEAAPAL